MAQTLETIKGGGGSIRVGTTGTISSLMTMELESTKHMPQIPISSRRKPQTVPVSVPCGVTTPKRTHLGRTSANEASSSSSISNIDHRNPGSQKTRYNARKNAHRIPMLGSDSIAVDRTPNREKTNKKGSYIVEVVDLKCGDSDKAWSNPITSRLKKLSFSKLSDSIG